MKLFRNKKVTSHKNDANTNSQILHFLIDFRLNPHVKLKHYHLNYGFILKFPTNFKFFTSFFLKKATIKILLKLKKRSNFSYVSLHHHNG